VSDLPLTEGKIPTELLRSLAVFAEAPSEAHERLSGPLGFDGVPTASDYSDVFLFQLYPYASVHLGPEGMMGGEARERVAGFWTALGYTPPAEPDHLAALLGLLATLGEAEASLHGAERALAVRGRVALMHEHVSPWVFAFLARVAELSPVYHGWADLLTDVLRAEVVRLRGVAESDDEAANVAGNVASAALDLPLHLRLAPPLPDPRREGSDAFLSGLLSPVRAGFVVARADLATIARSTELGLRAGERRYALEHLLAQSAPPVLDALAVEADRQGDAHAHRAKWLGEPADFMATRCRTSAVLLRELATEGGTGVAESSPEGGHTVEAAVEAAADA